MKSHMFFMFSFCSKTNKSQMISFKKERNTYVILRYTVEFNIIRQIFHQKFEFIANQVVKKLKWIYLQNDIMILSEYVTL